MGRMAKKSPPRRGAWRAIIYAIFTDELFGQKQNPAGVASGVRCFCGRGGLCGFSDLFARAADDLHGAAVELDSEVDGAALAEQRSEEHTSELQSLMRISYAVFCLKKKTP